MMLKMLLLAFSALRPYLLDASVTRAVGVVVCVGWWRRRWHSAGSWRWWRGRCGGGAVMATMRRGAVRWDEEAGRWDAEAGQSWRQWNSSVCTWLE